MTTDPLVERLTADGEELDRLCGELDYLTVNAFQHLATAKRLSASLNVHWGPERRRLYPVLAQLSGAAPDLVLRERAEYDETLQIMVEVDELDQDSPQLSAVVARLVDRVRRHVAFDRRELQPRLVAALDPQRSAELAAAMEGDRRGWPTHPHPHLPAEPNRAIVAAAGLVDRLRDATNRESGM